MSSIRRKSGMPKKWFFLGSAVLLTASLIFFYSVFGPQGSISVIAVESGTIIRPVYPFRYEDLRHPLLMELRRREGLDAVISPARTEFERFVLLRSWARDQWDNRHRKEKGEPYPNAVDILDRIRSGELSGGLCSEYAAVLMQACLSLGYQARTVSIQTAGGRGHRVNEVWSNALNKWVVMDAYNDIHYERDGLPLNALELHDALVTNDYGSIRVVDGGGEPGGTSPAEPISFYHDMTVMMRNDNLSHYDPAINRMSLGWVDEFTDGRPDFSRWISGNKDDFYWNLHQTVLEILRLDHARGRVTVGLKTNTPGMGRFTGNTDGRPIEDAIPPAFEWFLHRGINTLTISSENVQGVTGRPASMVVDYRPAPPFSIPGLIMIFTG